MKSGTSATVAVLGLGAMGGRAAATLVGAEHLVYGFDPDPRARTRAQEAGVRICDGAEAAVREADVVVLSLPYPRDVREASTGPLGAVAPGTIVVDISTIDPETARAAANSLRQHDVDYIDAPVLGRPEGCGRWTLPVGGSEGAVRRAAELLEGCVAKRIIRIGDVGAGSTVKLLNNLMFGAINAVTAESMAACRAAGIDVDVFADAIAESGAATVSNLFRELAPKLAHQDFSPIFALNLLHKDNRLATRLVEDLGLPPMMAHTVDTINTLARNAGYGAEDSSVVYRLYANQAGS